MKTIVAKFGGSSLADAKQFLKVKNIIEANKDRKYIVPSAPGKRFSDDIKVTDMLYSCYDLASQGEDYIPLFDKIVGRFDGIIKELELDLDLSDEYKKMQFNFENVAGRDYAASRGEYLNGIILAKLLGFQFIDAKKLIYFLEDGQFNAEKTNSRIKERLLIHEYAVIPGFYGKMPNDTIRTFSRGGSDVTGSLISRGAGANIYENWTDVPGFMVCDPRIVKNPKIIRTITYKELRELSYMGATVLHEDAVFPVRAAKIPINIRDTNDMDCPGTIIKSCDDEQPTDIITGIAGKKGMSIISVEKAMMNSELGFCRKVLAILERLKISFEHLPSGIDTLSIVIETAAINGHKEEIINSIYEEVSADHVEITDGLALIAVVGRGMSGVKGTAAKILSAVANANVNIRMIDQGSSELNVIIGIDDSDFEKAIKSLYKEFVD